MTNKVEGVYPTVDEAVAAVERLQKEDYSKNDITLVAKPEVQKTLNTKVDVEVTDLDTFKNAPVHDFRDAVLQGDVAVLISEERAGMDSATHANIQPNTVGPEGTRAFDEEQTVESHGEHPRTDRELTTDELEDYERRQ